MESDKPPSEPLKPTLDILLENPHESLLKLEGIIEATIPAQVEFIICDSGMMRFLNLRWRRIDRPTDVLTFDLSSPGEDPSGVVYVDGRLAPPLSEVLERVYHGWLHLRGMTHDTRETMDEMRRETALMVTRAMEMAGERE